jgi:transcriptional regulator with XRE-family HTH domain
MRRDEALVKAFGLELKARRSKLNLSQEALADLAAINRTYVAKLELGTNQPTLSILHRLAQALGDDLPELLRETLKRYERGKPKRR